LLTEIKYRAVHIVESKRFKISMD